MLPFGPGSASDTLARIIGQELLQLLGQPVVAIAKPGADGALSAIEVKRSAPDGYTYLFGTNSPLAVVPNNRKEPPYDVLADFTPITYLGDNTFYITVTPSLPVKSLAELIAYAKANPRTLNFAAGNTMALVAPALLATRHGLEMQAIPYKSEPDAITDVLSGQVQVMFGTTTTTLPHVKDGKLRALATTLPERSPLLPDVPSIIEAGEKPFPIGAWFALVGPAGLPPEIVKTMNEAMVKVLDKKEVKEQMLRQGFVARSSSPEFLAAYMKDQLGIWKDALKVANVQPQ